MRESETASENPSFSAQEKERCGSTCGFEYIIMAALPQRQSTGV